MRIRVTNTDASTIEITTFRVHIKLRTASSLCLPILKTVLTYNTLYMHTNSTNNCHIVLFYFEKIFAFKLQMGNCYSRCRPEKLPTPELDIPYQNFEVYLEEFMDPNE